MPKEFTVPGEPVAKARPRFHRQSGRAYTPKKSARFEDRVRLCAMNAGVTPIDGPVSLLIRAFWPSRKPDRKREPRPCEWRTNRPDVDNIIKAVCDGLNGTAYADDSQVVSVLAQKFRAAQGEAPRVEIHVVPLKEPPMPSDPLARVRESLEQIFTALDEAEAEMGRLRKSALEVQDCDVCGELWPRDRLSDGVVAGSDTTYCPECVMESPAALRRKNAALKALLREWRVTPFFEDRDKWNAWVADFGNRVDAALEGR